MSAEPVGQLPFNRVNIVQFTTIEDTDAPGHRVALYEVIDRIGEMDMPLELRTAHAVGLMAAQLSIDYIEEGIVTIPEKAMDIGMLRMLGYFFTRERVLTAAEIEGAVQYQQQILFTRVLEKSGQRGAYSNAVSHNYTNVESCLRDHIRWNNISYDDGRDAFRQFMARHVVDPYVSAVRSTPPEGADIGPYLKADGYEDITTHFLGLRRSLLDYAPTLRSMDQELWNFARSERAKRYRM
jgi:hypothetical protein